MKSKESSVTKRPWVKGREAKRIKCARGRSLEDLQQLLEQAKIDDDKIRTKMFQDMINCLKEKDKKKD